MDEILLSKIFALKVLADAVNAEIEGMKAENSEDSGSYSDENFQEKANELRGISGELNNFGRG